MPAFLAGCGVSAARTTEKPLPGNPFLDWFGIDQPVLVSVMSELTAGGADGADLFFQHRRSSTLKLINGEFEWSGVQISQGVGLRVVVGEQIGFAYTEDLSLQSMLASARNAARTAAGAGPATALSYQVREAGSLYITEVPWTDVADARKVSIVEAVDSGLRRADEHASRIGVVLNDVDERVMIATLDGRLVTDRRPMSRLSAHLWSVRNGNTQGGFSSMSARAGAQWYTKERTDALTADVVAQTDMMFEARRAPEGDMPVILAAGTGSVLLHEAVGHGLEADFNLAGKSSYSGMQGEQVAAPFVTLVDQADLPNACGALNVDDEGTDCGRNVLIEKGVLQGYLHDSVTARQFHTSSTGSARRQSYKNSPMPRMTCTFLEDGPHSRNEIISSVHKGIVAETLTAGNVALGSGDFRFRVMSGWMVEGGKITVPIKDASLTGNGPEMLRRISMVAGDRAFDPGAWTCGKNGQSVPVSHGMPTVLVPQMAVGNWRS